MPHSPAPLAAGDQRQFPPTHGGVPDLLREKPVRSTWQGKPGSWGTELAHWCRETAHENRSEREAALTLSLSASPLMVRSGDAGVFEQGLQRMPCSSGAGGDIRGAPAPARAAQPGEGRGESWVREGGAGSAVPARVLASCSLRGSSCSSWDRTLIPKPGTTPAACCRRGSDGTATAAPSSPKEPGRLVVGTHTTCVLHICTSNAGDTLASSSQALASTL